VILPEAGPVWHLFVPRSADRDLLREGLKAQGIATGVHYPLPLHLQPAYDHLGLRPGSLPHTERAAAEVVSLPIYPEMTDAQGEQVARAVNRLIPPSSRSWSDSAHEGRILAVPPPGAG
jgi:dTDP-4-amino-4,6-dideoxygalactose transaminase